MQRLFRIMGLLGVGVIACGLAAGYMIYDWADSKLTIKKSTVLEFSRGTALDDLSWTLESLGIVDSGLLFNLWTRIQRNYSKFQAGVYEFKGDVSPVDVSRKIMRGDTFEPIVLRFTIPEGFTMQKIFNRLVKLNVGSQTELKKIASSEEFLRKHNIPGKTVEGFLYPATYHFRKQPSTYDILSHLVNTFWKKLPEDYIDRAEEMGLSLQEAVTFASLIQLETKFADERAKVSEVIWRRLRTGSPLGIDAALIYGIEDYQGDIKWKHLKDKTNPYNTRIHKGLPPTPITNPDINSLLAVLSPSNKGYNYYVVNAKSKDGRHHFSRTRSEHNRYVKMLIKSNHGR